MRGDILGDDASLRYENLRLCRASFVGTDLGAAVFNDVSLREARFEDVSLSGATFSNVDFSSASIVDAKLVGMKIDGALVSDLFAAYNQRNPA
jgi:uncharacterized protein YjbI with pentapeptide repeats